MEVQINFFSSSIKNQHFQTLTSQLESICEFGNIIKNLKKLFPKSLFITSYKRPKNLKELLCPSKLLKEKQVKTNKRNSYIRCNKGCVICLRINSSIEFRSKVTRRKFVSRMEATCLIPNLIYLITCKVSGKQGVRSTEYLHARISNHYSHIKKKK